ncbi:MAG: ABC transporter substrate-binding protein [Thalassobaculales bacterium]
MNTVIRRALLAGALALPALAAAPAAPRAQVLEVAVDASPAGLDPHLITAFASAQIVFGPVYEGLTAVDAGLAVGPGLAAGWTVSPDGRTYSFTLRPGVTFHDGTAMEAADVVASFNRVLSKDIGSPLASRLAALENATARDARTVVLTLKEPSAPLLAALSTIAIVPRGFEANKAGLQRQPVGTGPFKFAEWQPNGFIRLARHDGYWQQGVPKLAGVKFNIVPESATRQVGLLGGQYHMLANIDAATALQLTGRPGVAVAQTLELSYTLIGMNTSKPPFDNPKVREAVNYALNREEIVQAALFGKGVAAGPLSPALKDWAVDTREFPCYRSDPAKAQALLREAGVSAPLAVSLLVLPRQDIRDIAQVAQQQLNKAGFKVELRNVELGQFVQDWRNSNFELFASANAGAVDPDDYFFRTFRSGGSTNVFKYADTEIDQLLDLGRATVDKSRRQAIYQAAQKKLACTGPVAHIAYPMLFAATRTGLSGFEIMANRSLVSLARAGLGR